MPNFFKPSMVDSKDYMEGLGIENPEAGKIDNSPGFMQKAFQTLITAGLEAAGGPAGKAVGEMFASSMNGEEMPQPGITPQQKPMAAGPMDYLQQGPLADTSTMTAGYDTGNTRAIYDKDGNLVKQPYGGAVIGNKWNIPQQFPVPIMDYVGRNTA